VSKKSGAAVFAFSVVATTANYIFSGDFGGARARPPKPLAYKGQLDTYSKSHVMDSKTQQEAAMYLG
jgi:hypothetical protein